MNLEELWLGKNKISKLEALHAAYSAATLR